MSIFEQATRTKLRFSSTKGELSVEQLWDLPLTGRTQNAVDLDTLGRQITRELKDLDDESFVSSRPNPRKTTLQLQLDVLKHIRDVKLAEREAAEKQVERAEQKARLQEILHRKENEELEGMSKEEIEKQLAALG